MQQPTSARILAINDTNTTLDANATVTINATLAVNATPTLELQHYEDNFIYDIYS